jgi:cephalosporin-C deacetylase-like acetyl esterase
MMARRTNIKQRLSLLFLFAVVGAALAEESGGFVESPNQDSADHIEVLWDLDHLGKAPEFSWYNKTSRVRSLHYKAEPFEGQATDVFAYYATPGTLAGDPSKDKNLPAIVLLHGGGGGAFSRWAELWASRGYAAIAMSLVGSGTDMKERHTRPWQDDVFSVTGPPREQWVYHAVSDAILAHSLIRSFPEVDQNRTAITGYSWGGYLTCIAASVDHRFKAAVPVYGCGFLHDNSVFKGKFPQREADRKRAVKLWDPSSYMEMCEVPVLMCDGGTDFAYPPDSHAKTYALIKSEKNLHFVPFLRHGHLFEQPPAAEVFIESKLNAGKPLAKIAKPQISNGIITAEVHAVTELVSAQLHYCLDRLPGNNGKRKFVTVDAEITAKVIRVPAPPEAATFWFLTVTDERGTTTSTELRFVEMPRLN